MKVFVVHRGDERRAAKREAKEVAKSDDFVAEFIILRRSILLDWRPLADRLIRSSEAVLIFNRQRCEESDNAVWEIERARSHSKPIIDFSKDGKTEVVRELRKIYNFEEEFNACFDEEMSEQHKLPFYQLMVSTSEDLIRRRQVTNGFYITILGGLFAASGFVIAEGLVADSFYFLYLFPVFISLILCRSWWRLLDNYGKLNTSKYRVISKIERSLGWRMFAAEWYALGQNKRPAKYRSFTETESTVPKFFAVFFALLGLTSLIANDWVGSVEWASDWLGLVP